MSELKDFLENVRKYSTRIGEVAMKHVSIVYIQPFIQAVSIGFSFNCFLLISYVEYHVSIDL